LLSLIGSSAISILERLVRGQFELTTEQREQLSIFLGFPITRTAHPAVRHHDAPVTAVPQLC
jgi:hypothetical protein